MVGGVTFVAEFAQAPTPSREGGPNVKVAAIVLVAALLAGCDTSTPTPHPSAPASSPAAQVDASPPVVNGGQTPPSSGNPAPSASAAPQPSPTPDRDAIRSAARAGFLAAGVAHWQAISAVHPFPAKQYSVGLADTWSEYAAVLRKLRVPADTAADLHALIRKVTRLQALFRGEAARCAAGRMAHCGILAAQELDTLDNVEAAAGRVRTDLGLPQRPFITPYPAPPGFAYP